MVLNIYLENWAKKKPYHQTLDVHGWTFSFLIIQNRGLCNNSQLVEADIYCHKELQTRCCNGPRSSSMICF